MPVHLAVDVFAASVADDLVMLDLPRGRYLCLSGVAVRPDGRLEGPCDRMAELEAAGLADRSGRPGTFQTRIPAAPARSVEPRPGCAADFLHAACSVVDALVAYRARPLAALVREAAHRRAAAAPEASPETLAHAAAFQGWAPFLPLSAKCLLRSFLLLRHLRRGGCDAVWVFGVRTWPFQAHCWLQAGDVVLDDHWERVVGYTPILAV